MSDRRRWLLPTLASIAVLGGFAGYQFAPWRESPREAWEAISTAAAAGDHGAVWDRFDPASQGRMIPKLREFAADPALTDRERFALLCDRRPDVRAQFLPAAVAKVHQAGDRASLTVDRPDLGDAGPTGTVYLTRHAGRWCLSYGAASTP